MKHTGRMTPFKWRQFYSSDFFKVSLVVLVMSIIGLLFEYYYMLKPALEDLSMSADASNQIAVTQKHYSRTALPYFMVLMIITGALGALIVVLNLKNLSSIKRSL